MVKSRLGRIDDKFFSLIPKALAFKPIDDIKEFVYSYVLDEKEVDIASLRENVRTYQDLEQTLESVKKRIEKLEQVEKHYKEAEDCVRRDRMYGYFLEQADADIIKETIAETKAKLRADEIRREVSIKEKDSAVQERDRLQEVETNLRVELKQNADYLALEEEQKRLEHLKTVQKELEEELKLFKACVKQALNPAEKLIKFAGEEKEQQAEADLKEYRKIFSQAEKIQDAGGARELLEKIIAWKRRMYAKLQQDLAQARILMRDKQEEERKLKQRISGLERKKLSYPEAVERLQQEIRSEFTRLDRRSQPHVLCELLEISDESWRNAVEGYLNTQRFYILVEPENFDIALSIYDRLRREKKAYGAGLINAEKMKEYDTVPEKSLASAVESKNSYARRYINMVLGKVRMCDRAEDLKKYPTAITRECMRYQNRVASAIKPEVFSVPYIGKQAYMVQLEQAKRREKILRDEITELSSRSKRMEDLGEMLSTEHDLDVKYRLDVLHKITESGRAIRQCEENIKTLKKNSTLIQKQIQLEKLEEMRRALDKEIDGKNRSIGALQNSIDMKNEELLRLHAEEEEKSSAAAALAAQAENEILIWRKEYEKQTSGKTFVQFKNNYDRQRKANDTSRQKAEQLMKEWMYRYKSEHDFGAPASMEGYPEFAAVYDRLRTSELLEYEEKVQDAKERAEDEFREQFLAKLQENMKQAQGEFKELNRALKDITFSNDRYEFLFMPGKNYRNYYEMIMDDFNAVQGESIFSGAFHEAHKEVIEELFDRLAVSGENNEKALDEFTDYRTYMDYDIKIIHGDGSYSYYSKVCEEKSGGETQTPFYVTVAASFVQLYGRSIGGDAAGLVLFDEAFNNMDDERIGGVLSFLNRLPLQIIISAPPEKIQYIASSMSETLLIMTDEKVSYVEEYHVL